MSKRHTWFRINLPIGTLPNYVKYIPEPYIDQNILQNLSNKLEDDIATLSL